MQLPRLLVFFAAMVLSSCTPFYTVKHLYDGSPRPESQVAVVKIDPHVLVLRIDDQQESFGEGGRKVLAGSAGIRRQSIALLPGLHIVEVQFGVLCLHSLGTQTLKIDAEPSKVYRIKSEVVDDHKTWRVSIVEYKGEEIPDPVQLTKAMCPVKVEIIYLPSR